MPIQDRDWYRDPNYKRGSQQRRAGDTSDLQNGLITCPTCGGSKGILGGWAQQTGGYIMRCPTCLGYGRIRRRDIPQARRDLEQLKKEATERDSELAALDDLAGKQRESAPRPAAREGIDEALGAWTDPPVGSEPFRPTDPSPVDATALEAASLKELERRLKYVRSLDAHDHPRHWLKKAAAVAVLVSVLGLAAHGGYYLIQGLGPVDAAKAIANDWQSYAEKASGIFPEPRSSEGISNHEDPLPVASPSPSLSTPSAAITATPASVSVMAATPASTLVPTPSVVSTAGPLVAAPTSSPPPDEIDKTMGDFINGDISREEAIAVLGEERVRGLDAMRP